MFEGPTLFPHCLSLLYSAIQADLPCGHSTYKLVSHVVTRHTSWSPMWSLDIQAGLQCGQWTYKPGSHVVTGQDTSWSPMWPLNMLVSHAVN
jgi:hypothetical protein